MGFTGIDDPYEPPQNPEIVFDGSKQTIEDGVALVWNELLKRGLVKD